jgi:Mg/Co/Ni transporter MgtE
LAKETIYRAYVVDGARKLIDSGGNAGSQAATLMVRGLAMGDTRLRDWSRMIGKEVLVAGLLGCPWRSPCL